MDMIERWNRWNRKSSRPQWDSDLKNQPDRSQTTLGQPQCVTNNTELNEQWMPRISAILMVAVGKWSA